jgi:hypothetical protein
VQQQIVGMMVAAAKVIKEAETGGSAVTPAYVTGVQGYLMGLIRRHAGDPVLEATVASCPILTRIHAMTFPGEPDCAVLH